MALIVLVVLLVIACAVIGCQRLIVHEERAKCDVFHDLALEQHHALVNTGIYAQTPILVKGRAILEPEQ